MGQAVEALATERGHRITTRFDSSYPLVVGAETALKEADVAIDFSLPDLALAHIERYCQLGVPAIVGTTGWYEEKDRVRDWVDQYEASLLYAPNFSIGVALLVHTLRHLAPLLDELPEYDVALRETHHTNKRDSPSGTALLLAEVLIEGLSRKTHKETETQHQQIDETALHITSMRLGSVFGEHAIVLDSLFDQITLTHSAKNRRGFAFGAVRAAEWLQKRQGLFTLDDMLGDGVALTDATTQGS